MDKKKIIIIVLILIFGIYFLLRFFKRKKEEVFKAAYDNLNFEFGKAIIKAESLPYLDDMINVLKTNNWQMQLIGHTDNIGSESDNLILSKQRADAVKNYFVSKGLDANRFETIGKGESEPIATNDTEQGREINRRVEFVVIK